MDGIFHFVSQETDSLFLILLCLCCSAIFSGTETAITSLGSLKVKHLIDKNVKHAKYLQMWLDKPERILSTILLFNTAVNLLASSITTQVTNKYVSNGAIGVATGIITFLVLIFGEIIPKSFGKAHAESLASLSMKLIYFFYLLGYPLILMLSVIADASVRLLSSKKIEKNPLITEEELEFLVSEGGQAGVIEDLKKEILQSAFDFDDTKVREIMTPRTDIQAVELATSLKTVLDLIVKTGHSRIPVFKGQIDHIVGLILAKDLLSHSYTGKDIAQMQASSFMRECLFAPESKSIMDVFKDLKKTKSHLAVIIDEYGGTAGIVTMEDILEEIVGDIQDEFDAEEASILKIEDHVFEVSGSLNIDEFFDYFNITPTTIPGGIEDLEVDTLAGWITEQIGQMPQTGQTVMIGDLTIKVLDVHHRRIELVRVEVPASHALPSDQGFHS